MLGYGHANHMSILQVLEHLLLKQDLSEKQAEDALLVSHPCLNVIAAA
jgi:Holliday junction resolvasome RuvABC endonuclease subunit